MAAIDDLIKQVEDEELRARLQQEADRLAKAKKFGLVFESHLPEMTPIYSARVKQGSQVAMRDKDSLADLWRVVFIRDGKANCVNLASGKKQKIAVKDLVVVRKFGEPVFPSLVPVDKVKNGPDDAPWHVLIEADNYHALQLLEYTHAGQVDCIYIDPPYNTGERNWKYNNDYVDKNDQWRHSKWLAFMSRRLKIAKRLLSRDGVLIMTVDDNEYAHLWMIAHDIFPEYQHFPITIQHNPGGTQGEKFSVTHEYALIAVPKSATIFRKEHMGGDTYNLRRWGSTSGRFEAATCFYPIYVNSNNEVTGFGDVPQDDFSPRAQAIPKKNGATEVWPIDKNGTEKKWRYARASVENVRSRMFVTNVKGRVEINLTRAEEQPKTVWTDKRYNADTYGSVMLSDIVRASFDYPKSIYAVKDVIACAVQGKPDAVVLDFFAGSGTTLHALNLLNATDGGARRGILVTNNEVSWKDEAQLIKRGVRAGEARWEKKGICRMFTWPRSKYTISGKRDDGSKLEGEYFSGKLVTREKPRKVQQINFYQEKGKTVASQRKQLVALLDGIPQVAVQHETPFVVSEDYTASVLFDEAESEAWLKALEGQSHIETLYIATPKRSVFGKIKKQVHEVLGPIVVEEEEKRLMSTGFPSNLEYFRLDFLGRDGVTLGRQFREILPILWLRAGARGPRPEAPNNQKAPVMLFPEHNTFAVLVDDTRFADFLDKVKARDNLSHVYLVTNSNEAFEEMASQLDVPNIISLYGDYLDNFAINKGEVEP